MDAVTQADEQVRPEPAWFGAFREGYQNGTAHAFTLTGDINGFAVEDVSHRSLLFAKLSETRDVVAYWHLASGGVQIFGENDPLYDDEGNGFGTRRQVAEKILLGEKVAPRPTTAAASLIAGNAPAGGGGDPFKAAQQPAQALALLQTLLVEGQRARKAGGKVRGNVAVVIEYADALCPAPAMAGKGAMGPEDRKILVTLLAWAKDRRIDKLGNPIFLLARDHEELHPDLRASDSGWRTITIAKPDRQARLDYLTWYLAVRDKQRKTIALRDGLTVAQVANLTAGLNLRNLEDVLMGAYGSGGLTRGLLKAYKDQIVQSEYSNVAEMIDPLPGGFADLGGMETFKAWARRRIIEPMRQGRVDDAAKGVELVGPPGVGKSYAARALAQEIGFSGVALNADKILGGIVGESERNLARFFEFCRSLAPVLVFMDELDQSDMAQRGNTSGNPVAKNLFSAMLKFLSDETLRGQVIVLFATNRPDLMDTALVRSGRVDAIIPILLPSEGERVSVLQVQAKAQGTGFAPDALAALATGTDGWNNGDLAAAVRDARIEARDDASPVIALRHVETVLDDMIPSGLEEAKGYTLLAVKAVNRRRNLPPEYADLRLDTARLNTELAQARPAAWEGGSRSEREL